MSAEITSRLGVINMPGLIWDQFHSSKYRDMLLYAWRHTDPEFMIDELENGAPPATVTDIQFDLGRRSDCQVRNCNHRAFIRCSHCGKLLCLQHFLNRTCLHRIETRGEAPVSSTTPSPPDSDSDGSSGAALIGIATGISGGAAGTAVAGAAVAGATGVSSGVAGPSSSKSHSGAAEEHEMRPLIDAEVSHLEGVIVQEPPASLDDLIRDRGMHGLPSRC